MKTYLSRDTDYFKSIDGNMVKSPVAYCTYSRHRGYLTEKQIKVHGCLKRGCPRLSRLECEYWEERKNRKKKTKLEKRQFLERVYDKV